MTRYKSLIVRETCHLDDWFQYESIGSLFIFKNDLSLYYDDKNGNPFEWKFSNLQKDYKSEPIYGIKLLNNLAKQLEFTRKDNPKLFEYLSKYNTTYYYKVDYITLLFVFDTEDPEFDIVFPNLYQYEKDKFKPGTIVKGTIPLMHFVVGDPRLHNHELEAPTTMINNRQFTYQSALLKLMPVQYQIQQTYFYGFNQNLDHIYFAKDFALFARIPQFLHPEKVVGSTRWHPFRCFSYIYIMTGNWILIFPHLDLNQELPKLKNPLVIQVSLTVMHRNTFFQCSNVSGTSNTRPVYPDKDIKVFLASPVDVNDIGGSKEPQTEQQFQFLVPLQWIVLVISFIVILVVTVVFVLFLRKRKLAAQIIDIGKNQITKQTKTPKTPKLGGKGGILDKSTKTSISTTSTSTTKTSPGKLKANTTSSSKKQTQKNLTQTTTTTTNTDKSKGKTAGKIIKQGQGKTPGQGQLLPKTPGQGNTLAKTTQGQNKDHSPSKGHKPAPVPNKLREKLPCQGKISPKISETSGRVQLNKATGQNTDLSQSKGQKKKAK